MLLTISDGTPKADTSPASKANVFQLVEMIRAFLMVRWMLFSLHLRFNLPGWSVEECS